MISYFYISGNNEYPKPSWHVIQVTLTRYYSLIEMRQEATERELIVHDLFFVGVGEIKDKHIQENIARHNHLKEDLSNKLIDNNLGHHRKKRDDYS